MRIFFEWRDQLAPGIWQHAFRPERPVRFEPGQYVSVQLEDVLGDPRGSSRTFTLTSLPDDSVITFVSKDQPLISPYKEALAMLLPGDAASITDPMGDLILPMSPATPLLFVAGGIGICSYTAMLRWLLEHNEPRSIRLWYGLRFSQEMIFSDILDAYPFASKQIAVSPQRIRGEDIASYTSPETLVYISGSEQFVEDLVANLQARGVSRQQIIFDFFEGYAEL